MRRGRIGHSWQVGKGRGTEEGRWKSEIQSEGKGRRRSKADAQREEGEVSRALMGDQLHVSTT
jgi:hypothetical protein